MNIYYQWEPWSYSHLASLKISENLSDMPKDIVGLLDFDRVWDKISEGNIGVLPIENSYAGTIHHNAYNFLSYDHKIIWEYNFEVKHCLLSLETDKKNIKEVYSHHQALSQTYKHARGNNFIQKAYGDTAWAAKMLSEKQKFWAGAIASELAGELYNLHIVEKNIQDQSGNTTKFLIVVPKENTHTEFSLKKWRTTLLLKTDHTPWSLYECLHVFAQENINMTKIESIPLWIGHFSYAFWITVEGSIWDDSVDSTMKKLMKVTDFVKILWEY